MGRMMGLSADSNFLKGMGNSQEFLRPFKQFLFDDLDNLSIFNFLAYKITYMIILEVTKFHETWLVSF